ncbi:MAG: EAL domain-containing protein [Acetatifactor sp.]|nr:EAL domain-containing protein [Acetatifactor sp.]
MFLQMIAIEICVICLDMLSSYMDNNYEHYSILAVTAANMLFFVAFYTRALVMYVFNLSVLDARKNDSIPMVQLFRLPYYLCAVMAVISPVTKLVFYIDEAGYHSGPLYNILYVCSFFYLFLSYCVYYLKRLNLKRKRERYCLLFYNFILTAGLIARFVFPKMLLMDTFCLMAIIVVYLAFENPEYYLELRGSVFNSKALKDYLEENMGHLNHRALAVTVHKYIEFRDIYGTSRMDEALALIARYLTSTFKGTAVFYFKRGSFIMLFNKRVDYADMSKEIYARFQKPWKAEGLELFLNVGFSTFEISNEINSSDILLNTIGSAMTMAEAMDGDTPVEVTNEVSERIISETEAKRALEIAIESKAVEVFLQPLISADTGMVIGAEALARIKDLNGKIMSPGIFIPIAENSGRINELGEQVFEKTCKFIKENDLDSMGVKWINVNLSPIQFIRPDLGERYAAIAEKYGVDPEKIHMEITEESMIDDNFLQKQVKAMESKGFKFVLDDYGTGYSNIARLKKCPFINIKLDMALVWDYYKEPDVILPSMIDAFKKMNFGITSEGIEDESMAEEMRKLGCDYLQGFYYSKPIPMDEFVEKYSKQTSVQG